MASSRKPAYFSRLRDLARAIPLCYTRDPSLRLKSGSVRDDSQSRIFKLSHYPSKLSSPGNRYSPGEADPGRCEHQQLPRMNQPLAPHIHIIDD